MIYPLFAPSQSVLANVTPEAKKQLIATAAGKCRKIVEPLFNQFESTNPENFLVAIDAKKTMRFTQSVATLALMIVEKTPCKTPDLSKFDNEFDSAAIKTFLNDKRVEKVKLAASAKGTEAEQLAISLKKLA